MSGMSELHMQTQVEKEPCPTCDTGDKPMNIGDLTLEQLMAEDYGVWVKKNDKFGYDVHLDADQPECDVKAEGIHPFAMESMACFCRAYLASYEKAQG